VLVRQGGRLRWCEQLSALRRVSSAPIIVYLLSSSWSKSTCYQAVTL